MEMHQIVYKLMWRIEELEKKVNFTWHAYEHCLLCISLPPPPPPPPPPPHPLLQLILICSLMLIFLLT